MNNIVIIGRPNVGKSTLFNRLAGRRRALVHDLPGMTRDLLSEVIDLDDGRQFELVDTGGLEYGEDVMSAFAEEIRRQSDRAAAQSDLILFLVDGIAGVLPEDREIATRLRPSAERVVVVVNKIDAKQARGAIPEFYELGFERLIPVSAEHGEGVEDLWTLIEELVPGGGEPEQEAEQPIRLAIIGRPNAGKSSLLNLLTREERSIVSEIPGTTRDAIDALIEREGDRFLIVDTAGIRRKGKTTTQAEKLAVISARKAIERCEIALVMIDGVEGVTAQDATVAGYAEESGRAAMLLVNKWDIVERTPELTRQFEDEVRQKLKFLQYAPIEFISAKTGRRVEKLFPTLRRIAESFRARFGTAELNRILEQAVARHNPPSLRGKPRRFYYATQLRSGPPTIALFSNSSEPLHFSYKRYLENQFREALRLTGTPVHLLVRGRKGMKRE
ncbi:MAG TPA: ribosome biogenesis GTPase Der [Thermoanaerobaculia bacterium]|nr:ribosome biogenesis GTPase Der [Thermoanaerobaculia bacterium]